MDGPKFETPPLLAPEVQADAGAVIAALLVDDPALKEDAQQMALLTFVRWAKTKYAAEMKDASIPYGRSFMKNYVWSEGSVVHMLHHQAVIPINTEHAIQSLKQAFEQFWITTIDVIEDRSSDDPEEWSPQPSIFLDSLECQIIEMAENVYSFSWKQRLAVEVPFDQG